MKGATMNQRIARMKPASMLNHDDPSIRISTLINFMESAQQALESKGEVDAAFRFECLAQYLREDHKPGTPLIFSKTIIGM